MQDYKGSSLKLGTSILSHFLAIDDVQLRRTSPSQEGSAKDAHDSTCMTNSTDYSHCDSLSGLLYGLLDSVLRSL